MVGGMKEQEGKEEEEKTCWMRRFMGTHNREWEGEHNTSQSTDTWHKPIKNYLAQCNMLKYHLTLHEIIKEL